MKEFSQEELARYNGENGQPVYIAHQGKVYDVSASKMWRGGQHMKRHNAGQDLTTDLQAAPHDGAVLERYPQIGTLKTEAVPEVAMPAFLEALITRFPFLRRHPHPMTVHFPIVFMFSTAVFSLLYLITGGQAFETTAFHCLGAGVLFNIVGISTGYYTWWLNYFAQPLRAVAIKQKLTTILLLVSIVAFVWRLVDPAILRLGGVGVLYCLLVFSLIPLITVIGWFGASLTFPVEKE